MFKLKLASLQSHSVSMVGPQVSLVDRVDCHAHLRTCLEEKMVGLVIAWSSRAWSNITTTSTWNCQHVPLFPAANLGEFVPKKSNITINLLRSSPPKKYSPNRFPSSCWMFHWEKNQISMRNQTNMFAANPTFDRAGSQLNTTWTRHAHDRNHHHHHHHHHHHRHHRHRHHHHHNHHHHQTQKTL